MSIVKLNVGGFIFVTYRSTLRGMNTTFFNAILEHHSEPEIFVDRDATHFRYILNWLRGVRHLPEEENTLSELLWEADYFNIQDMVQAIQCKLKQSPYNLNTTLLSIRDELRQR